MLHKLKITTSYDICGSHLNLLMDELSISLYHFSVYFYCPYPHAPRQLLLLLPAPVAIQLSHALEAGPAHLSLRCTSFVGMTE